MENERDISRKASSLLKESSPSGGLLFWLLVLQWYSTTCLCTHTDVSLALDIPWGKSSLSTTWRQGQKSVPSASVSGPATQGLWPALCQLPSTVACPGHLPSQPC